MANERQQVLAAWSAAPSEPVLSALRKLVQDWVQRSAIALASRQSEAPSTSPSTTTPDNFTTPRMRRFKLFNVLPCLL
jgi:hypothetical protein